MLDITPHDAPTVVREIEVEVRTIGFTMSSDTLTGTLLRTLAASKPGGLFLELGTGAGMGSSWILEGMDAGSRLVTVDLDARVVEVAKRHLGHDPRITFQIVDGVRFIESLQRQGPLFDFIFADSYPGKFLLLPETLTLLKPGGLYIIDDLLPQPGWGLDHQPKVDALIETLTQHPDLRVTALNWSTGIVIAARK
jgi:predicted O-methyltransferase YrrM